MSKFVDNVKANWKHVLVAFAALAALGVSLSGNQTANDACQSNANCKAAYDAGVTPAPADTSTTIAKTVDADGVVTPVYK